MIPTAVAASLSDDRFPTGPPLAAVGLVRRGKYRMGRLALRPEGEDE